LLFDTCGGRRLKLITHPYNLKVLLSNGAAKSAVSFLALCGSVAHPPAEEGFKNVISCIAFSTATLSMGYF
jgi:hypothetical protein